MVCFVPFSCPGDKVRLDITNRKKSYLIADIAELVSPSALRTVPVCAQFGLCGGCSWQHVSYHVQLEQKRQIFADTLWRGARVDAGLISSVVAAPELYGYRNRVQLKISARNGKLQIGFFRHNSHLVEDAIEGCPIAVPLINEMLLNLRSILSQFAEMEAIPQISIDAGRSGVVAVFHYSGRNPLRTKSFLVERQTDLKPCSGLLLQTGGNAIPELLWGNNEISYAMPGVTADDEVFQLKYRPGGFAQVNQSQNRTLLAIIRKLGSFTGKEHLLDLYCGNGNFSLPLAAEVASVTGIEGFKDSISSAKCNLATNNISNAKFVGDDVCRGLMRLVNEGNSFDTVLLDPPRSGAKETVPDIARLGPAKIIYVSCDPATLARDCGLLSGHGYRVVESVPVDMFPQTYHLESVTLLEK